MVLASLTGNLLSFMLGAVFLVYAIIQFFRILLLSSTGIGITATIIDFIEVERTHGLNEYFPVLKYQVPGGDAIVKKSYIGLDKKHSKNVGDQVKIICNPDNPGQFIIDSGIDKYWRSLGSFIIGLAFTAAGIFNLY